MEKIKNFFKKNEWIAVAILLLVFLFLRLPGTDIPLHQDEYKWPMIVSPANNSGSEIPHPPLSQFIYRTAGEIVGFNVNFRFVPLFFGAINLLLLYYFLRMRFGKKEATIGATLFILSYFSILASLMVDTDGQIMPFFFLLSLISYQKISVSSGKKKSGWFCLLVLSFILGFFIKVSFALAILAIVADWLWQKRKIITKKDVLKYFGFGLAGIIVLALLLILSQYVFSFFNLSKAFVYWEHFAGTNRNWFQTGIQVFKAILYLSPFLLLPPFFLRGQNLKKVGPFLFYILFGMIFYIVLFDFSTGALDRYLQFLIVPLCVLSAVSIVSVWQQQDNKRNKEYILLGVIFALILMLTLFIPQFVPSLYPKSAWINRAFSLKWNFLYPFSGGSGPLGFYISFLFLALNWIVSVVFLVVGLVKPNLRKMVLLALIPISLIYNGVFAEEYLFGKIYGSAQNLIFPAVEFIKNNPDIKFVTVYNDNGGNEVRETGKYRKRLYTDPSFDINDKIDTLNKYKENYLEVNIPRIDSNSVYRQYLDSCKVIYDKKDKYISAKIYDCKDAPDIKIK